MEKDSEYFIRDLTIDDEYDVINSESSVKDAALKMKELGIPDLVVTDNENKVIGVIADFDIVTGLVAEGLSSETAKVTEIMYTIDPVTNDTPVSTAFTRMRDLDVSVIPVVENDQLVGVATITDCWGFLPEKYEDQKGLIAVANPRIANYGFTLLMTLLYLCFGIVTPLIGISGFLKAPVAGSAIYTATYYLFEARGGGFWFSYLDFPGEFSIIWLVLFFYGFLFLALGIISAFAIFHWANADYHLVKQKRNWQAIGVIVGLVNLLIEWSLFLVIITTGALRVSTTQITPDVFGLFLSVIAIIFLIAAASRDILFKESTVSLPKEE